MKNQANRSSSDLIASAPGDLALLANGSSGHWEVAVDETLNGEARWFLQLDSPTIYLALEIASLNVVSEALHFLLEQENRTIPPRVEANMQLGQLGSASVSLVWDNESLSRCFVIIGPEAGATCRVTLLADDLRMLTEALQQVVDDLPAT